MQNAFTSFADRALARLLPAGTASAFSINCHVFQDYPYMQNKCDGSGNGFERCCQNQSESHPGACTQWYQVSTGFC